VARPVRPTIAEGTAIQRPVRLAEIVQALRETHGATVALTEAQITAAVQRLAASGLYTEPTSASAAAAIDLLAQRGDIRPGETTVALLTGTGLKATQFMSELFGATA
jgi:threonine synthase